jgi:hypothetical protein
MKTILTLVAAALVLSFTMTESVEAKGSKTTGGKTAGSYRNTKNLGNSHFGSFHGHHSLHRDYRGWSRFCWMPRFRCYGYYCPQSRGWFYLYERGNCFLPVSCLNTYAPTPVAAPPATLPMGGDIPLPEGALPVDQIPQ